MSLNSVFLFCTKISYNLHYFKIKQIQLLQKDDFRLQKFQGRYYYQESIKQKLKNMNN